MCVHAEVLGLEVAVDDVAVRVQVAQHTHTLRHVERTRLQTQREGRRLGAASNCWHMMLLRHRSGIERYRYVSCTCVGRPP